MATNFLPGRLRHRAVHARAVVRLLLLGLLLLLRRFFGRVGRGDPGGEGVSVAADAAPGASAALPFAARVAAFPAAFARLLLPGDGGGGAGAPSSATCPLGRGMTPRAGFASLASSPARSVSTGARTRRGVPRRRSARRPRPRWNPSARGSVSAGRSSPPPYDAPPPRRPRRWIRARTCSSRDRDGICPPRAVRDPPSPPRRSPRGSPHPYRPCPHPCRVRRDASWASPPWTRNPRRRRRVWGRGRRWGRGCPLESALRTHGDVHDGSVADAQLGELVDAHLGVLLIFRGPVSAAARPLLSFRGRPGRFALGHALVCACGTARREGGEGSVRRRVKRGVEGERGDAEGKRGDAEDAFGDRATWGCRRRRADGGEKRRVGRPAADDVCPERREKPTAPPGRVARASRARGNLARGRDAALDPNARRARSRVARGVRGEIAGGRSEAPRAPGVVCAAGVETSGRDLARGAPSRVVLARTRSLVFELTPVDSLAQEFYLRRHRRHACAPWSRARSDAPPERPPLPHVEASGRSQSREFSRALEFPFYSN